MTLMELTTAQFAEQLSITVQQLNEDARTIENERRSRGIENPMIREKRGKTWYFPVPAQEAIIMFRRIKIYG